MDSCTSFDLASIVFVPILFIAQQKESVLKICTVLYCRVKKENILFNPFIALAHKFV